VLLVFLDPACRACDPLLPELERQHRHVPERAVLAISRGTPEANRRLAARYGLTFPILLQRAWDTSRQYRTLATPVGYLVDERGVIASPLAVGAAAVLELATARQVPVAP
jgi:peroxiredoxin